MNEATSDTSRAVILSPAERSACHRPTMPRGIKLAWVSHSGATLPSQLNSLNQVRLYIVLMYSLVESDLPLEVVVRPPFRIPPSLPPLTWPDSNARVWGLPSADELLGPQSEEVSSSGPARLLATIAHAAGGVNTVRFSPCGRYLASCADDHAVIISEQVEGGPVLGGGGAESWRPRAALRPHASNVLDLAWSPDSSSLASVGLDGKVVISSPFQSDRPPRTLPGGHSTSIKGVAWDPMGRFLATQGDDGRLLIWRVGDGVVEHEEKALFVRAPTQLLLKRPSWSPDGAFLVAPAAVKSGTHVAALFQRTRTEWAAVRDFAGHAQATVCARFLSSTVRTEDGGLAQVVAVGAADGRVSLWRTNRPRALAVLQTLFQQAVTDLAWSPDGRLLLMSSSDGTLALLALEPHALGQPLTQAEERDRLRSLWGAQESAQLPESIHALAATAPPQKKVLTPLLDALAGRMGAATPTSPTAPSAPTPLVQLETVGPGGKRRLVVAPQPLAPSLTPSTHPLSPPTPTPPAPRSPPRKRQRVEALGQSPSPPPPRLLGLPAVGTLPVPPHPTPPPLTSHQAATLVSSSPPTPATTYQVRHVPLTPSLPPWSLRLPSPVLCAYPPDPTPHPPSWLALGLQSGSLLLLTRTGLALTPALLLSPDPLLALAASLPSPSSERRLLVLTSSSDLLVLRVNGSGRQVTLDRHLPAQSLALAGPPPTMQVTPPGEPLVIRLSSPSSPSSPSSTCSWDEAQGLWTRTPPPRRGAPGLYQDEVEQEGWEEEEEEEEDEEEWAPLHNAQAASVGRGGPTWLREVLVALRAAVVQPEAPWQALVQELLEAPLHTLTRDQVRLAAQRTLSRPHLTPLPATQAALALLQD